MQEVRVITPATVANVVCGFDCLGFALSEPFDEMLVRRTGEPGIRITHNDEFNLPTDPRLNMAGVVAAAMLKRADADFGVEIEITKHIMPGSGIGSSSASAVGAAVGMNRLLDDRFSPLELVDLALEGETLASGSRHADNVAPGVYGGFTLVRSVDPVDIVALEHPPLWATIIHPQVEVKTAEARSILPAQVPLQTAVRQWSNVGSLVAGLAAGDYGLIARSLEDLIVEPVRRSLIPHLDEIRSASVAVGALGGGISGSGPSMFMLSETEAAARSVEQAMHSVYGQTGIKYKTYVSAICRDGAHLLNDD